METTSNRNKFFFSSFKMAISIFRTLEASGVVRLSANLAVDLNEPLHGDQSHLTLGESVFQAIAKKNDERERLAALVGARSWLRGPLASELVEHPVAGRIKALEVLLRSTSLH